MKPSLMLTAFMSVQSIFCLCVYVCICAVPGVFTVWVINLFVGSLDTDQKFLFISVLARPLLQWFWAFFLLFFFCLYDEEVSRIPNGWLSLGAPSLGAPFLSVLLGSDMILSFFGSFQSSGTFSFCKWMVFAPKKIFL